MNEGWIKIFYRLLEWEWYSDTNMVRLFIHLLLKANYRPQKRRGADIPRGSFVTKLITLSQETGLSVQQIRTCLNRLKSTNEITIKPTNKDQIITLCNYRLYQSDLGDVDEVDNNQNNTQSNNQPTNNQQSNNNQITCHRGKKGRREEIEEKEIEINKEKEKESSGRGILPIDELLDKWIAEASDSPIWLDAMAKNLQMAPLEVVALMRKGFRDHCICNDKRHRDITDFKSHFNRWASQRKYSSPQNETFPTASNLRHNDSAEIRQQEFNRHIIDKLAAPDRVEPDISGNY